MNKLENDLCNKLKEYVDLRKEIIMTETKLIKVHVYHIYWANTKAYKIIACVYRFMHTARLHRLWTLLLTRPIRHAGGFPNHSWIPST